MFDYTIPDPKDVNVSDIAMRNIYADWGLHTPMPEPISGVKQVGLTIADYTGRFINPIMGKPKAALSKQETYYAGYAILIITGLSLFWIYGKRG